MRTSWSSRSRGGSSRLLRPDLPPRILLTALVSVIGFGLVPFLLLRLHPALVPLLSRMVPSPDSTRIVEWLSLVLLPLVAPSLLGAVIMGSRRAWTGRPRREVESEILTAGALGLSVAQGLAIPVGVLYFRTVGLPIVPWELALASLLGALGGAIGICAVRLVVLSCRGHRFLGALAALPLLALAMLPAVLRLASPLCRRLAPWTPYYHVTLPLELRSSIEPGRILFSVAILAVWLVLGRRLVMNRSEEHR